MTIALICIGMLIGAGGMFGLMFLLVVLGLVEVEDVDWTWNSSDSNCDIIDVCDIDELG